jgi:hypothetical protein
MWDRPNPRADTGNGCAGVTDGGPRSRFQGRVSFAFPWASFRAPAPGAAPKLCAALPHDSGTKRRVHSPPFLNWSVTGPVDAQVATPELSEALMIAEPVDPSRLTGSTIKKPEESVY